MRRALGNALLTVVSLCVFFVGAEIATRLLSAGGTLWEFRNYVSDQELWDGRWHVMRPDPQLGYVPLENARGPANTAFSSTNFDAQGLRVQHRDKPPAELEPPILAVGDSFTMGSEVGDDETWPAFLESALDRRVLNAGVGGYGFDQAVLRAEMLVPRFKPSTLLVGFIADDIARAQMRLLWGLEKPYFDIVDGKLVLRNVPLATPVLDPKLDVVREVFGYSYLMDVVMRRLGYGMWWRRGTVTHAEPAHAQGAEVACLLMERLRTLANEHDVRVVLVAQYSRPVWDARATELAEQRNETALARCARAQGLDIIDTHDALAKAIRTKSAADYHVAIHLNAAGNKLTADTIADWFKAHP